MVQTPGINVYVAVGCSLDQCMTKCQIRDTLLCQSQTLQQCASHIAYLMLIDVNLKFEYNGFEHHRRSHGVGEVVLARRAGGDRRQR